MPRHGLILRIFVASPSDVAEERHTLDHIIAELNRIWSTTSGVFFESVKWETHVRPGFATDPQSVINNQINEDYDVFLGIFWSRIGTSTGRYASGTVEEFELAYSRFQRTSSSPEIMLYFKDSPISPSKIDGDQFIAVQNFKNSITSRGGFYSTFDDQASFGASVRAHLSAIAQKFSAAKQDNISSSTTILTETVENVVIEVQEYDTDLGLFDYLDIYCRRSNDMTAAMNLINRATSEMGDRISSASTDLAESSDAYRKHLDRGANAMEDYANILEQQVPILSEAKHEAFSALSNSIVLLADFPPDGDQFVNLKSSLENMIEGADKAEQGMTGLRQTVNSLPRLTKQINAAKRRVGSSIENLLSEITSTRSTVANIIKSMNIILNLPKKPDS